MIRIQKCVQLLYLLVDGLQAVDHSFFPIFIAVFDQIGRQRGYRCNGISYLMCQYPDDTLVIKTAFFQFGMIVFELRYNPVHFLKQLVQELVIILFREVSIEIVIIDCAEEAFQLSIGFLHFPHQHDRQGYNYADTDKSKKKRSQADQKPCSYNRE